MSLQVWMPLNGINDQSSLGLTKVSWTKQGTIDDNIGKNSAKGIHTSAAGDLQLDFGAGRTLDNLTMGCWLKFPEIVSGNKVMFGFPNGSNQRCYLGYQSAKLLIAYGNKSWSTSNGTTITAIANKWYHVMIRIKNKTMNLFVDGVKLGQQITLATAPNSAGNIWIFDHSESSYRPNMVINDFRFYDEALADEEIARLAHPTVACWNFDDPFPSGIYEDNSGYKRSCTAVAATAPVVHPGGIGTHHLKFEAGDTLKMPDLSFATDATITYFERKGQGPLFTNDAGNSLVASAGNSMDWTFHKVEHVNFANHAICSITGFTGQLDNVCIYSNGAPNEEIDQIRRGMVRKDSVTLMPYFEQEQGGPGEELATGLIPASNSRAVRSADNKTVTVNWASSGIGDTYFFIGLNKNNPFVTGRTYKLTMDISGVGDTALYWGICNRSEFRVQLKNGNNTFIFTANDVLVAEVANRGGARLLFDDVNRDATITNLQFSNFHISEIYPTIEKDGAKWMLVMHHQVTLDDTPGTRELFRSSTAGNQGLPEDRCFSRLEFLPKYWYNNSNEWEFLVEQYTTNGSPTPIYIRWKQFCNPGTCTWEDTRDANNTEFVTSSGYIRGNLMGVYALKANAYCVASNSAKGNWWGALGSWAAFNNGIPGYNGSTVTGTLNFYVRIPNDDGKTRLEKSGTLYADNFLQKDEGNIQINKAGVFESIEYEEV